MFLFNLKQRGFDIQKNYSACNAFSCYHKCLYVYMFYRRAYPWSDALRLEYCVTKVVYALSRCWGWLFSSSKDYSLLNLQNKANEIWTDVLLFKLHWLTSYTSYLKCSKRTFMIEGMQNLILLKYIRVMKGNPPGTYHTRKPLFPTPWRVKINIVRIMQLGSLVSENGKEKRKSEKLYPYRTKFRP